METAKVGFAVWSVKAFGVLVVFALMVGSGCDDGAREPDAGGQLQAQAFFPPDIGEHWREMRDCRHSHEHELRYIRVLASPTAEDAYAALSADTPYPVGAMLVKLEYDEAECSTLLGYTAMRKLDAGTLPDGGDWRWQKLDAERHVLEDGALQRCINCHEEHCAPPFGYDLTCAEEL